MIESVFASKLNNQVSYKEKPKEDVRMEEASKAKGASTRQRQLDYLKTMRYQSAAGDVTEDTIVRELLFVFQGIDGQLIKYQGLEDAYVLTPQVTVSPSTHKLIAELCELGWLYKKVNDWLLKHGALHGSINQVTQSLCFVVQAELTEYYRLLAVLDSQRTRYNSDDSANYLNLKKLYLWV